MFLRGRLQWSLLSLSLVSGVLALVSARVASQTAEAPETTTTTTTTTTTVYQAPIFYVIQRGDNLFQIARTFNVDMSALMRLNGISNPDRIEAGQILEMPPATGFVPVAPSTTMLP
ncbi:MAG: LysM peptidoglycan-binding domain-containing protein [Ilumatobacteraceae bacterium]